MMSEKKKSKFAGMSHAEGGRLGRERKKAKRKRNRKANQQEEKRGPSKADRLRKQQEASKLNQIAKELAPIVLEQGVKAVKRGDPAERKTLITALRLEPDKITAIARILFCEPEDAPKGWSVNSLSTSELRNFCDRFFRPGISQDEKDRRKRAKLVAKFAKRHEKKSTGELKKLALDRGLNHGGIKRKLAERLAEWDVSQMEERTARREEKRRLREEAEAARRDERAQKIPQMYFPSDGEERGHFSDSGMRHLLQCDTEPRTRSKVARKKNSLWDAFEAVKKNLTADEFDKLKERRSA